MRCTHITESDIYLFRRIIGTTIETLRFIDINNLKL